MEVLEFLLAYAMVVSGNCQENPVELLEINAELKWIANVADGFNKREQEEVSFLRIIVADWLIKLK